MSKLLILRTKVLLTSEDQMELQSEHDFGIIKDDQRRWVYRRVAHICSEVMQVIEYNKNKTLLKMWNDTDYLVDEPFDQVKEKWEECKKFEEEEESDYHEPEPKDREEDED